MEFSLNANFTPFAKQINYTDNLFFIGSCFANNIMDKLVPTAFKVNGQTHGIIFNPLSIANSLVETIQNKVYDASMLQQHQELWHSFNHHGSFSHTNINQCLQNINETIQQNNAALKKANWLFITLGTAYAYYLNQPTAHNNVVANCHKYPATHFNKKILELETIKAAIDPCYHMLKQFNPNINVVFTVSPVKYLKDGIIENNRSKARLIEIAHHFCNKFSDVFYFPAYELVNDILRDYRFYNADFAHPTEQAINFVYQQFKLLTCNSNTQNMLQNYEQLNSMKNHKVLHTNTEAYKKFKENIIKLEQRLHETYIK
jgi:hypothetical protein